MSFVRVSCLGNYGRFGNQLFQYALGRALADAHGVPLEAPPWVGDVLFPAAPRSEITDRPCEVVSDLAALTATPPFDIAAYCVAQECLDLYTQADARRWFALWEEFQMPKPWPYYVACHVRAGDFLKEPHVSAHAVVSRADHYRGVTEHGYDIGDVLTLMEELPRSALKPLPTREECGYDLSFLPDWEVLKGANVLFRANSTFSWWAGELADHEAIYAPVVGTQVGPGRYDFAPGNHHQTYPGGTEMRLST